MTREAELWRFDAVTLAKLIRTGEVTARAAVESALRRLDDVNPKINAVVQTSQADKALAEADKADAAIHAGEPLGSLHGVPITVKINTDQKDCITDNGVRLFEDLVATEDNPCVVNLRNAGAIIIGRTNCPAFSMRFMTDNILHGKTLNPWNRVMSCGGSSGGAGAAVATGIGAIAQGNDIGGSIRWPAFCNGVVGLRPTVGRIPSYNSSSSKHRALAIQLMAVEGPIARTVADVRTAFKAMCVGDFRDPWWVPAPFEGPPVRQPVRVALVTGSERYPVNSAARESVRKAGEYLASAGYHVEEANPPGLERAPQLWNLIVMTEMRPQLESLFQDVADDDLERSLQLWWEIGDQADLAGYMSALEERDTLIRRWNEFMEDFPIIVMPTCAHEGLEAWLDARDLEGMIECLDSARFLMTLPVLGLPGLAVPVGLHDGMPQGVQVISRRFREDLCFEAGEIIEAREGIHVPIDPQF